MNSDNDLIIKKAENVTSYDKIPDLMNLLIEILNPANANPTERLPLLECEKGQLTLLAKIEKQRKPPRKKTFQEQIEKTNEQTVIKETLLKAEEEGKLTAKSKAEISKLLKNKEYQYLSDERKVEIISNSLSLEKPHEESFIDILTLASLKDNPSDQSINKLLEIAKKLFYMLDTINLSRLKDQHFDQLEQELTLLKDRLVVFLKECGDRKCH